MQKFRVEHYFPELGYGVALNVDQFQRAPKIYVRDRNVIEATSARRISRVRHSANRRGATLQGIKVVEGKSNHGN